MQSNTQGCRLESRCRQGEFHIDIPGYSISGEIGRGGMAVVYRARQVLLDREVALKVLNPPLAQDPVYAQRFLQEARMLASLGHPHIVQVYDVGVTDGGLHYFSMQMLRRGDFARRLREGVDEVELVRVLIAVAQALGFAHARGYVHRDVTPANILFDDQNRPVLTDFGIARALAATSRMTASGLSIGTSHYMSPEQARGGEVDRRSDIYSLGVLTFEALTGRPPYDGEDGFAVAYAHVHEPVPTLPSGLARWQPLIDNCMAKVPDQRYPDCGAFIEGLRIAAAAEFGTLTRQYGAAALGLSPLPSQTPPAGADRKRAGTPRPEAARHVPVADDAPTPVKLSRPATPAQGHAHSPGAPSRLPLYLVGAVIALGLGATLFGIVGRSAKTPAYAEDAPVQAPKPAASSSSSTLAPSLPRIAEPAVSVAASAAAEEFALVPDLDVASLPTVIDPVADLLARGRFNMAAQRYTTPAGNNAHDRYALALVIEPGNAQALAGLADVAQVYIDQAKDIDADAQAQAWDARLALAERIAKRFDIGPALAQIDTLRNAQATILIERGQTALRAWDTAAATAAFERAAVLVPASKEAAAGLREAARVGTPGYVFRDPIGTGTGPELIVAGGIALGRKEVSVAEFRAYWNAAGRAAFGNDLPACRDRESIFRSSRKRTWSEPGFAQTDAHPVVCISAAMADGYVAWLSERSGKRYRLPRAAELGALGAGFTEGCKANVHDAAFRRELGGRSGLQCDDGHAWTAPRGTFAVQQGGLYDTGGNVREWTGDCDAGNCRQRQAVGASWASEADDKPVRALATDAAFNTVGLRVAREID